MTLSHIMLKNEPTNWKEIIFDSLEGDWKDSSEEAKPIQLTLSFNWMLLLRFDNLSCIYFYINILLLLLLLLFSLMKLKKS